MEQALLELEKFREMSNVPYVQNYLDTGISTVSEIIKSAKISNNSQKKPAEVASTKIDKYSWTQTNSQVKIYVDTGSVCDLSKSTVTHPKSTSLRVTIVDAAGKSHVLSICLFAEVDGDASSIKVSSSGRIIVSLTKTKAENWDDLMEKKSKPMPKLDENEDPQAGLMKMMQQMYEDGDDEMKRTMNKAWCEARAKQQI